MPVAIEEDAADVGEKKRLQRLVEMEAERKRQAQAIQRALPIPRTVNHEILRSGTVKDELVEADEVIKREMLAMLEQDTGSGPVRSDWRRGRGVFVPLCLSRHPPPPSFLNFL